MIKEKDEDKIEENNDEREETKEKVIETIDEENKIRKSIKRKKNVQQKM